MALKKLKGERSMELIANLEWLWIIMTVGGLCLWIYPMIKWSNKQVEITHNHLDSLNDLGEKPRPPYRKFISEVIGGTLFLAGLVLLIVGSMIY